MNQAGRPSACLVFFWNFEDKRSRIWRGVERMRIPGRQEKKTPPGLNILVLTLFLLPVPLLSQISRLSLDLSNTFSQFSRGRTSSDIQEQRYDQLYTLDIGGYTLGPDLLSFSLRSGLRDESLKTSGLLGNGKAHGRSFDLYNLSIDLFRRSPMPITLYTSRNSQTNSYAYSSGVTSSTYETISEVTGFAAALQGNGYWPQLRMGWNRSSTEGTSPLSPFDRHSNNLTVSLANADDEQVSSYSVDYRSSDSKYVLNRYVGFVDPGNTYIQPPRRDVSLSASVRTTMWENVGVASDFMQHNQDHITNRTAAVNVRFQTARGHSHVTSFQQRRNYGFGTTGNTYNLVHSLSIAGNGAHQGRIQGEFTKSKTAFVRGTTAYDRLAASGSWIGSFEVSQRNKLVTTTNGSIGQEGYSGLPRAFIYSLAGNLALTSQVSSWLRSTLSDDIAFQRYLAFGRAFNNKARLTLQATPGLMTTVVAEASRSDSRFPDQLYLPQLRVTTGSLSVSTSALDASVSYSRTLYHSAFRDLVTSAAASLLHRGLVRNLTITASGNFTKSSYPGVETVKFLAGLSYQFYAYSLSGNYFFDRFGLFRTAGFYLGIRRQISVDFR